MASDEFPTIRWPRHIPNAWSMQPVRWRPHDITDEMMGRLLPRIPHKMIRLQHLSIIGKPGSGKSELIKYLAKCAWEQYGGAENVHIINTDDLRVAIEELDDRPVQLLVIDDAMQYASSRRIWEQSNLVGEFQRLRHLAKEASGRRSGLVLAIFSWQRYQDLDPAFRESPLTIFKTGLGGEAGDKIIGRMIGPYMIQLREIWDRIDRGNQRAKSQSVGYIASLSGTGREAGVFRSQMVDFPEFPAMIHSEGYDGREVEVEIPDRYAHLVDDLGEDVVRCYVAAADEGLSTREAAERVGIPHTTCYRNIRRVREALGQT